MPKQLEPMLPSDLPEETNPQTSDFIILQKPSSRFATRLTIQALKEIVSDTVLQIIGKLDSGLTTAWRQGLDPQSGTLVVPTLNVTTDGDTISGTAAPGTTITALNPVNNVNLVNSQGNPISTTVAADTTWTLTDFNPDLVDGQAIRIRSTDHIGDNRSGEFTVEIGVPDSTPPTGTVAFVFPNGSQTNPNTLLSVQTTLSDDVTVPAELMVAYQWGYLQQPGEIFQPFVGAVGQTFDPVNDGGENAASAREIVVQVRAEDAAGNVSVFTPPRPAIPQISFVPNSGNVIVNYIERNF